jgi:hypothetical protein
MPNLMEVPFSGGTITFAVAGSKNQPQAYSATDSEAKAQSTWESALDLVKSFAETTATKLRSIQCDEAEAKFGLSVTGKGKFIIAEASTEASIEITLKFKNSATD